MLGMQNAKVSETRMKNVMHVCNFIIVLKRQFCLTPWGLATRVRPVKWLKGTRDL